MRCSSTRTCTTAAGRTSNTPYLRKVGLTRHGLLGPVEPAAQNQKGIDSARKTPLQEKRSLRVPGRHQQKHPPRRQDRGHQGGLHQGAALQKHGQPERVDAGQQGEREEVEDQDEGGEEGRRRGRLAERVLRDLQLGRGGQEVLRDFPERHQEQQQPAEQEGRLPDPRGRRDARRVAEPVGEPRGQTGEAARDAGAAGDPRHALQVPGAQDYVREVPEDEDLGAADLLAGEREHLPAPQDAR